MTKLKAKLLISLLWLANCAPSTGYQAPTSDRESITGFLSSSGAPYTVGADSRLISVDRGQATPQPTPQRANALATKITAVRFKRLNSAGRIDRFGTARTRVEIQVGDTPVRAEGNLSPIGANRFQAKLSANNYSFIVEFEDAAGQAGSTGLILLSSLDNRGRETDKAEIFIRAYSARTEALPSEEQKLTDVNLRLIRLIKERGFAWVVNTVIGQGRSFYEVQVFASADSGRQLDPVDAAAGGRRLFSFGGEAVRTGDFEDHPAAFIASGLLEPKEVTLIGDAETEDARTFAVLLKGQQNQTLDLALRVDKYIGPGRPMPPLPPSYQARPKGLRGLSQDAFLNARYGDPRFPRVKKMIDDLEKNYEVPGVQKWIEQYKSATPRRDGLLRALQGAIPARKFLATIFHAYDVAPPAALVTFIESRFFSSGTYVLETNQESSASGPFQLLWSTAEALGLKVQRNARGQLPKSWDHRLYLLPSACAAANHLAKSLEGLAQRDSTLAIAAYYLGDWGAASAIHQALNGSKPAVRDPYKLIHKYNLSFREIDRQKMLPSSVRDYVNKALALYFVTGNPQVHGISWNEAAAKPIPRNRLMPGREPFGDLTCRKTVALMMDQGLLD